MGKNFTPQTNQPLKHAFLHLIEESIEAGTPMQEFSDKEQFIRRTFKEDAKKGCELLFKLYYKALCSHAVRFVYSKQVAEDLVGEVFYVFWQKQRYTQIHTSYRAYLFTAVRQRALTYIRWEFGRDNTTEDVENVHQVSPNPSPEQLLQFDELYFAIEKAIQSMPPQSQKVFLMNRFEGKKYMLIAKELQISLKTVEAHMTKALTIVRKAVKGEWLVMLYLFYDVII